jgi:hypothetical protein
MSLALYLDNDNLLTLEGLTDAVTGLVVNSATVSVTLLDKTGAPISGETWPLSLGYVAASQGVYRATLRNELVLGPHRTVTARIVADDGPDRHATWEIALAVQRRTS